MAASAFKAIMTNSFGRDIQRGYLQLCRKIDLGKIDCGETVSVTTLLAFEMKVLVYLNVFLWFISG